MAQRTAKFNMRGAIREERIRQFAPISPGYFVVYYDVHEESLVRQPVVAWGVREREEWRFQDGEQSDHMVCDFAEAMVPAATAAEAVFASDLYDTDDLGNERFRLLGIGWSGDGKDWNKEMKEDIARLESVASMHMGVQRREKRPAARRASKAKR